MCVLYKGIGGHGDGLQFSGPAGILLYRHIFCTIVVVNGTPMVCFTCFNFSIVPGEGFLLNSTLLNHHKNDAPTLFLNEIQLHFMYLFHTTHNNEYVYVCVPCVVFSSFVLWCIYPNTART